jgi:lysozyme
MKTSMRGLIAIAKSEGIVPAPYIDPVGVWTFGIGHTKMSGAPDPEKMPRGMPEDVDAAIKQAVALFQKHIKKYEDGVNRAVKVPLAQNEFDALVSFHFNTGAISRASATEALNRGDREDAARRLTLYNKGRVNGQLVVLEGLVKRREEERRMFLFGEYPRDGITVWKVNANNKYSQALRIMPPAELEALMMDHPAEQLFDVNADLEPMTLLERFLSLFRR